LASGNFSATERRVKICRALLFSLAAISFCTPLAQASHVLPAKPEIIISVKRQTMTVVGFGAGKTEFPISTSKFGVGSQARSFRTPLGEFRIDKKVGANLPSGAVFKGLRFTGEVVKPNSPGRDPIVTRVLCLSGGSAGSRGIYIHGTPEEKRIGKPASYGCIRMRSRDVIALFNVVPVGTKVVITDAPPIHMASAAKTDAHGTEWYR
jgi:lipoprotein-anchoring transpeptidase ErfK/SrfK